MVLRNNGVNKIVVLIPHQDDEINLMGGLIPLLVRNGIEVHFVYLTNGDVMFNGAVRIGEAIAAADVLGVRKEQVHFLGYLDSSNTVDKSLYKSKDVRKSKYSSITYGDRKHLDYSYIALGEHSSYTYVNLKRDLRLCLEQIHPEVIFVTDFDGHHDHRLCSMVFDEVLNEILLEKNHSFAPYVYRGFAYSTAFKSEDDFYHINIKNTVKPMCKSLAINTITELDNPVLGWDSRIRFPVDKECTGNFLKSNIVYEALKKHLSQSVSLKSKKLINADKVFWERPANNLLYKANITVSSGCYKSFLDFRWFDINNIGELKEALDIEYIGWNPDENDTKRMLSLNFNRSEYMKSLSLYINGTNVEFDICINDVVFNEKCFYRSGKKYAVVFNNGTLVDNIDIILKSDDTKLLYAELLSDNNKPFSFAKISLNGNYAYNYIVRSSEEFLKYEINSYGLNGTNLQCVADNEDVMVGDGIVRIPAHIESTLLSINDVETGTVYDVVRVTRLSNIEMYKLKFSMFFDNVCAWIEHRKQKLKRRKLKRKTIGR